MGVHWPSYLLETISFWLPFALFFLCPNFFGLLPTFLFLLFFYFHLLLRLPLLIALISNWLFLNYCLAGLFVENPARLLEVSYDTFCRRKFYFELSGCCLDWLLVHDDSLEKSGSFLVRYDCIFHFDAVFKINYTLNAFQLIKMMTFHQ